MKVGKEKEVGGGFPYYWLAIIWGKLKMDTFIIVITPPAGRMTIPKDGFIIRPNDSSLQKQQNIKISLQPTKSCDTYKAHEKPSS